MIATESFKSPSPKIMEWILGNWSFFIKDNTDTVSVAVKVADSNNKLVFLSN